MNTNTVLIANRYKVIKTLEGGMGVVHLCIDEENNKPLALKTFKPSLIADNLKKELFLKEITLWIKLGSHPNIVQAYNVEFNSVTNEFFLGMELVPTIQGKESSSLRSWLTGLPISLQLAIKISSGIARGMQYATEKIWGLVHRDLKPDNILINIDEQAKITDFGLAKFNNKHIDEIENLSKINSFQVTNNASGTPLYMSPEQWSEELIDLRSDIYAFGCILSEMLIGSPVVNGESLEELRENHEKGMAIQSINSHNFPQSLLFFLQKCLYPEKDKRFSSWNELSEELNKVSRDLIKKEFPEIENPINISLSEQNQKASSFISIAQAYITINDLDNANHYFLKAIEIGKTQRNPILLSAATSGLGIVLFNQGDFEKARNYYQEADNLIINSEIKTLQVHNKINISNAFFSEGDNVNAQKYILEAILIAKNSGNIELQVYSHYAFANILSASGNYKKSLDQYDNVLQIIKHVENHILLGGVNLGIGTTYFQIGNYKVAEKYFQTSLIYSLRTGNVGLQINSLIGLAKIHLINAKTQEALKIIEEVKKIIDKPTEKYLIIQSYSDIGALLNNLNKPKEAIPYLMYAINASKELKLFNIEARTLFSLGMAYELLLDMPNAIQNLKKSSDMLKSLKMPEYETASKHLSELINALKN